MTNQDYEFRVTLSHDQVWCEYEGPGVEDGDMAPVPISRDEHMETIQLLEAWLKRWEWIARRRTSGCSSPTRSRSWVTTCGRWHYVRSPVSD